MELFFAVVDSRLPTPKCITHKWLLKTNTNDPVTCMSNMKSLMLQTALCFLDIKFLKGCFCFGVRCRFSVCAAASCGTADSQTVPFMGDIQLLYSSIGAAVHFSVSFMLSVQGRPGKQGYPGLTGTDGLKVRLTSHAWTAETLSSLTEHSFAGFLLW